MGKPEAFSERLQKEVKPKNKFMNYLLPILSTFSYAAILNCEALYAIYRTELIHVLSLIYSVMVKELLTAMVQKTE